ncbi:hypothetical protein BBJ28_00019842, partial [Nothophytophthora sp. Chile5]
TILRFRGSGGGGGGSSSNSAMLQLKFGMAGVGGSGRNGASSTAGMEAQRQREMRQQMLNGAADAQELLDADMSDVTNGLAARGLRFQWKKLRLLLRRRLYPFTTDIRQIEARFGYSVASYFRFFAWIIATFSVMALPCVVLLVLHVLRLVNQVSMCSLSSLVGVDCAKRLTFSCSASIQDAAVDWLAFSGVAPTFLQFPGYLPDEAALYSVRRMQDRSGYVLILTEALLLLFTLRKWIAEDRMAKAVRAVENASEQHVSDLKKTIVEQVKLTMDEENRAEAIKRRTKYLQIAGNAAVFAPYASSIVPAAVTVINALLPKLLSFLTAMEKWDDVGFAIKAMVTRLYLAKILNVLIQLFSFALLLDPLLLTSTQNVLGLVTLDGSAIRQNVMLEFKPASFACRAEQASAGLLTLVVTDFSVSKVMAVASPLLKALGRKVSSIWRYRREKRAFSKESGEKHSARVLPAAENADASEIPGDLTLPSSGEQTLQAVSTVKSSLEEPKSSPEPLSSMTQTPMAKSEFLVPQKMVALLYSCTIALVAIPLAPTTALLALVLHVANFKFDKFTLMHFQKKSATPWNAKDAGSFFVKFYFCTVLLFLTCTHVFLMDSRLPKRCELQDSLGTSSDDSLCVPNSYDAALELCSIDATHSSVRSQSLPFSPTADGGELTVCCSFACLKSAYFLKGSECSAGYPRCICEYACGPFTEVATGYSPLLAYVEASSVVSAVYSLLLDSKLVVWTLLFVFSLSLFFLRNSLAVFMVRSSVTQFSTVGGVGRA